MTFPFYPPTPTVPVGVTNRRAIAGRGGVEQGRGHQVHRQLQPGGDQADQPRPAVRWGSRFVETDLRGARFVEADLSSVVMRGVDVQGADIDGPWLSEQGGSLVVNGVDVVPLVEAELDRRYPGRTRRRASDPAGLRAAWAAVGGTWAATLERVAAMSAGTVDVSVGGEWSFAQTLRHLVMATDVWLRRTVLRLAEPYHPLGQPYAGYPTDGHDMSVFATGTPRYGEVLQARADRVAQVGDFLATVTPSDLSGARPNPWNPDHEKTVLGCLHVILREEWEHHRYAVRDLDALAAGSRQG